MTPNTGIELVEMIRNNERNLFLSDILTYGSRFPVSDNNNDSILFIFELCHIRKPVSIN